MKRIARFALLGLTLSSAAAITLSSSDELARDAALQWLQLIDAGRYEEAASQGSQEMFSFEQWMSHVKNQRTAFGRLNRRQFLELKRTSIVAGVPEVRRYQTIRFKTSFERKPTATEQITIAKIGCCWEIFEYKVE